MSEQPTYNSDKRDRIPYIGWLNVIAVVNVLGFIVFRASGYEMSWWWLMPAIVLVLIVFIASMVASGAVRVRNADERSGQEQTGTITERGKDKG
jgi:hypothetical protein